MPNENGRIYGLFDPRTGWLRYVGKTRNSLDTRLSSHLYDASINHRTNWIRALRRTGHKPIIRLLSEHPLCELDDAEIATIASFRATGAALLNLTDGGSGCVGITPSARARGIQARRARVLSPEYKAKQKETRRRTRIRDLAMLVMYWRQEKNHDGEKLITDVLLNGYGVSLDDPLVKPVIESCIGSTLVREVRE